MKIKDIIRENTESDLDLFGKPGAFNAGIKKAIKQIERLDMKIYELIENNDDDDELFGRSRGTKPLFTDEGLPKLDPGTQRRLMDSTNHWLGILPELSEWRELVDELGEDTAEKIIADFVKFRDYVRQNNIVAAIGSIQRNAQDYDWDEAFQYHIESNTGIDIWDLMDIEDKNQFDAFSFYAGRRRLKENDESDKELFAYRNPKAVRVDGRAVDMRSIRIGDIMQSDYPDFVDAYVDAATFRDGTRLSNEELDQLKDVLVDQGMWETMIMDQITSMYESDESDEELFGTEASRKFAICSSDGEILKELENVTVQQAMEMARKMSARFSDDYDDLLLIRSNIDGEYDDAQEIPFSKKIDESDMSDDEMFGNSSTLSRAAATRIRKDDPEFSSLAVKINQLVRKLQNSSFDWDVLRRGSTLYDVLVNNDRALDEIIWELPDHVLERIIDELENLCDRYVKESELAEAESDDELFGGKSHKRRNQLKIFDPDALPRLDPATQQKVYQALPSVLQDIQEDDDWDGFAENDPVQAERVLDDFTNFGRYIQQNNPVAALAVLDRNAVNYDLDESFLYVIERYTGVDMHSLVDLNDPNQEQAWHHYRSGVMKENTMNHAFESMVNEYTNMLTEAELAEPDEPERKAKTQTKQKSKLDPNMFAPKADQPLAKTDPLDDIKKNAGTDKPEVNIKKASQSDTLKATGKIAPTDDMRDMLSRMRDIDIDPDLAGYPDPKPPETLPSVDVNTKNLPAVAGQALLAAGVQNPDFHQVANLPGNMADMIRQLGKNLFGALTVTPTKRIHVVANLGGQGPNTNQEVQAVAGFLKEHGEDLGPGDIDFDNVMPGYSAQTHMFNAAGIRWMLVKDFAGAYIYCWPEEDSLDASPKLSNNTDTKQLR